MPIKLIILDRDGVLNEYRRDYVKCRAEFQWIAGSQSALRQLIKYYPVEIASNQSAVGRGIITLEKLQLIDDYIYRSAGLLRSQLNINYCMHTPAENCECRKPRPGLINAILKRKNILPAETIFIGDNETDFEAAKAAQVNFAYVKTGLGTCFLSESNAPFFDDLSAFAEFACQGL